MLLADDSSDACAQRRIEEGLLHQALAVIEGAAHRERAHVVAPAGELPLLGRGDQALGEQHHDVDARAPVEGRRHRAAGVARRWPRGSSAARAPAARSRAKRAGEEARAEVLERRGRARGRARARPAARPRPAARSGAGKLKASLTMSAAAAARAHRRRRTAPAAARPPRASSASAREILRGQSRPGTRHVEAAIRRKPLHERLAERQGRRAPAGAAEEQRRGVVHGSTRAPVGAHLDASTNRS